MQPKVSKMKYEGHLHCKWTSSKLQNLSSICSHWKPVTSLKNCDCCTKSVQLVLWAISGAVFKTNPVLRTLRFLKIKATKVSCGSFLNLVRKRSNLSWSKNRIDSTQTPFTSPEHQTFQHFILHLGTTRSSVIVKIVNQMIMLPKSILFLNWNWKKMMKSTVLKNFLKTSRTSISSKRS